MFGSISHQPPGPVKMLTALGWWWHTPHDLIDRIDPSNLNRDTRIVLHIIAAPSHRSVLPLDYAAYATLSLRARLGALSGTGSISTRSLLRGPAAGECGAPSSLAQRTATDAEALDRPRLDAGITCTRSGELHPGDRFRHDSALPHPAWPSLDGLRELAAQDAGSTELPFYVVHARQTRNRLRMP